MAWEPRYCGSGTDHWIFIDVNALVLNPKNHKWDAKCRCLILNSHFSMLFKLPTWRLFSWLLGLSLCLFWVGAYQPCDNSEILFITPLNLPGCLVSSVLWHQSCFTFGAVFWFNPSCTRVPFHGAFMFSLHLLLHFILEHEIIMSAIY